jgi:hypothetical protein
LTLNQIDEGDELDILVAPIEKYETNLISYSWSQIQLLNSMMEQN